MKNMVPGILVASVAITACSTTKLTGTTVADGLLQKDTLKLMLPYVQAKLSCNSIDSVRTSPVSVSAGGVVSERWQLSGCNREFAVRVNFTPSTSGGVGINITPEE